MTDPPDSGHEGHRDGDGRRPGTHAADESRRGVGRRGTEDREERRRRAWDDDWDRGSWDRDDWDRDDWGAGEVDDGREIGESDLQDDTPAGRLSAGKAVGYTAPKRPERRGDTSVGRRLDKGHQVAFMLLAGIGLGAGIGYGLDRLIGTFPALMLVGVFVGFGIALYAVYIETR